MKKFDLPVHIPGHLTANGLAEALALDKKAVASGLRLVLLNAIGEAVIDDASSNEDILRAMNDSRA